MFSTNLDNMDRKLLGQLQAEFPLTAEPYTEIGLRLGISGDEVINRICRLKELSIVRQISPVLDARKLGYQSTLVAMKVADRNIKRAEQAILKHPGVSHGYERDHGFNIWITLSLPQETEIEAGLEQLASTSGAEAIFDLPALKVFKLRALFGVDGDSEPEVTGIETNVISQKVALTQMDRLIINELQQDLPLESTPFTPMSVGLGMGVEDFLTQCRSLLERGVIRRYGAAINHRKAGYQANAMACWVASPERVDVAGQKLASLTEVSHCYERKTNTLWRHNLFAMIHHQTRRGIQEIANRVSSETGLTDGMLLFSTRELKKTRLKYLV